MCFVKLCSTAVQCSAVNSLNVFLSKQIKICAVPGREGRKEGRKGVAVFSPCLVLSCLVLIYAKTAPLLNCLSCLFL